MGQLVAVVIVMVAKEEVRWSNIKCDTVSDLAITFILTHPYSLAEDPNSAVI